MISLAGDNGFIGQKAVETLQSHNFINSGSTKSALSTRHIFHYLDATSAGNDNHSLTLNDGNNLSILEVIYMVAGSFELKGIEHPFYAWCCKVVGRITSRSIIFVNAVCLKQGKLESIKNTLSCIASFPQQMGMLSALNSSLDNKQND